MMQGVTLTAQSAGLQDASELSVSVELSPPTDYVGGLYIGKRLGYSVREGWQKARSLPPLRQGSAVVHRGNLTHGVSLKDGERWSLIIFFFRSCATQTEFFVRAEKARDQQRRQRRANDEDHWWWQLANTGAPMLSTGASVRCVQTLVSTCIASIF